TTRRPAASSSAEAWSSPARRSTRASATWRTSPIPTGTSSCFTAATHLPMRPELLERYRALPLPTTKDEHWRFTDLAGFDPDAWPGNGAAEPERAPSLLELDVGAVAQVSEGGIHVEGAPEGVRFEALPEDHELLYSLVGWEEKFAAHNAAMWKHGLLVHVRRGAVVEKPFYVRIANALEGGSLFWRLLVVAEPESRFALIEEYASSSPQLSSYTNAAVEIF